MYAFGAHFSIRRPLRRALALCGAAGACALSAGCVGNPFADARVDPASPVAPEVARVAHVNRAWPQFSQIPPAPKDVRPPQQYGRAAQAIEQARADLEAQTAPETWSLTGTEGFANQGRSQVGSEAPPQPSGVTGAFANEARKRATPPPPSSPR